MCNVTATYQLNDTENLARQTNKPCRKLHTSIRAPSMLSVSARRSVLGALLKLDATNWKIPVAFSKEMEASDRPWIDCER